MSEPRPRVRSAFPDGSQQFESRRRLAAFPLVLAMLAAAIPARRADSAEPRILVEGFRLEQIARQPDVVTPIGAAFDAAGRLLLVESHTHQRGDDYQGPTGDRIRALADSDGDGRLDQWSTVAEGFRHAMNLCPRPDGGLYVVTRRDVSLLCDADGDGSYEKRATILRLQSEDDYPHNGLGGIARAADGSLVVGFGENHGLPYKLIGSDDSSYADHGGSGTIFHCDADGKNLERWAVGFWNPFALCFTNDGEWLKTGLGLMAVDNDPDASPPCRLIDVIPRGDYGHRYEYGRAGIHPLQAWNGELPGTLPMVCGVGEAPTAIVFHRGYLWVTSWGDHRIERYRMSPMSGEQGRVLREVVVQGDEDFRPTGMAAAPDGSLYFGDWVDRSYPVHGKGRVWRLAMPEGPDPGRQWREESWQSLPSRSDARVEALGLGFLGLEGTPLERLAKIRENLCVPALKVARWQRLPSSESLLHEALAHANPDVRLYAVRWIADERLLQFRDDAAKLLDGEIPDERYYLAVLAAVEWLDGDASMRASTLSDGLLARELKNPRRSASIHALALRMISPDHEAVTIELLKSMIGSESAELPREAVRTLAAKSSPQRMDFLARLAADESADQRLRAEAIVALAASPSHRSLLERIAQEGQSLAAREASRMLRLSGADPAGDEPKPAATDLDAWNRLLAEGGDAAAGERLFFAPVGPRCAVCHKLQGRGGDVGPDLTHVSRGQSRERIVSSILQPSREIAPHYQAWTLVTADGKSHAGLKLPQGGDDGSESYADGDGRKFTLRSEDIELRSPSDRSIMPDGLEKTLSVDDLRDLLARLMPLDRK